ncbi:glycoside hydrolase family 32 protein [Lachnospiraceae bacterium JLR.KK008]
MRRDKVHLKAPGNWINDPNGFIYYKGCYHLFYQYFPYAPIWGTMHWGHAVSKDLVNWEHKGIALFPSKYGDQNGCFSGSAVEHEGRLYLYYTGIHYETPDPDNIHVCLEDRFEACQMLLVSDDGETFDNFFRKTVVIPPVCDRRIGDRTDTRDPKVWRGSGGWYMVVGSKTEEGQGKLLFYKSADLLQWSLSGSVSKPGLGRMWECPDYFETEGGGVLMFSPMGFLKDGRQKEEQAICMRAVFDEETCDMDISDHWQYIDYGLDLYAAQSTTDAQGRRVMVAWMRMPEAVNGAWIGMYCIPRVVEVSNGHIYFRVHPDVDQAYSRRIASVQEAEGAGYRLSLEIEDGETVNVGGYLIRRQGTRITTDRSSVFAGCCGYRLRFETPDVKDGWHLDIYAERNLIEVFVNHGEYVISNVVYGLSDELQGTDGRKWELYAV